MSKKRENEIHFILIAPFKELKLFKFKRLAVSLMILIAPFKELKQIIRIIILKTFCILIAPFKELKLHKMGIYSL